jgi:hypothetical protein
VLEPAEVAGDLLHFIRFCLCGCIARHSVASGVDSEMDGRLIE